MVFKDNQWQCVCGNISIEGDPQPSTGSQDKSSQTETGYSPCSRNGGRLRVSNTFYYICNVCGRIFHKDTLRIVGYQRHQSPLSEAEKTAIELDTEKYGWPQHTLRSQSVDAPQITDLQKLLQFEIGNYYDMNPFDDLSDEELVDDLTDAINRSHIAVYNGEYEGKQGRFMLVAWSLACDQYALYFLPQSSKFENDVQLIKQDHDLYSEVYA